MSLIAPASTGGCYCERLHSWFLFLFLSQLMLPVVLQSHPSRIFQWYSVSQCFNCVLNDYKMQLRLGNFGLSNSILINIPKLRFLYWQSTEKGEKEGGGEGEKKRGREGGREGGRRRESCPEEQNRCFSLALLLPVRALRGIWNSLSCYLETQLQVSWLWE